MTDQTMDYILTQHARDVLAKRQIEIHWMEQVLTAPEVIEPDPVDPNLEHRLARVPQFGDRVLRAIISSKRKPPLVVTVLFDRRRTIP
ncbi:DUF4258 domain-containing protein [Candidatus Methylacidithermus pantelleriae]|uniref:DUF4258 domain-containing protein n=1 Tax=Candidatus Methylacidithermus pantelleriae TaxID=2744239 RepID=A0A8J2BNU9_9BACT|nr:DUF4258 domain-containing protein [Candidatus Methylacidithermus pantelleriae]CAF0694774.1 conserved hypothetical protein [Candidatus Methylacidithermus pantelleriae]